MARQTSNGRLPRSFYLRPVVEVARDLLGKVLRHRTAEGEAAGRIVEVEAYLGEGEDPASHAHRGRRGRAAVMYQRGGTAYVYLSYGMHRCMNVVGDRAGVGGAVLLRALEPVDGVELMRVRRGRGGLRELASGPGKLAQALAIGPAQNGADLVSGALCITDGPPPRAVGVSPRIGISKAVERPLRFFEAGSAFLSRPLRGRHSAGGGAAARAPARLRRSRRA